MPRLKNAASGVVLVLIISILIGLFGHELAPHMNETPQQYAMRLFTVGTKGAEDLYLRALLLTSGGAVVADTTVTDTRNGGTSAQSEKPRNQDTLKQPVAKNEDEINDQQVVSAKRYADAVASQKEEEAVVFPEQPDEIRSRMQAIDPDGPEMRCSDAISSTSSVTTRNIELRCTSTHMRGNSWKYEVTFINHGSETVQMLTRHWVFVNSEGVLENEVKGPGARGVTPVVPPGGQWSYESGTSLATPFGSMHGSFQFEVLKGDLSEGRRSFSARVGRLLLARDTKAAPRKVPCASLAESALLPGTSVMVTERVIIGGRADFSKKKKDKYHYSYDIQINNARADEVEVVGHAWEIIDSSGKRQIAAEGLGVGGSYRSHKRKLAAGDAFRVQGELIATTLEANAQCTYRLLVKGENGLPVEIEAGTDLMGLKPSSGEEIRVPDFIVANR